MTDKISIRPAQADDAAALAAFSRKTFIDAFAAMNNKDDFDAYVARAFSLDQVTSELHATANTFFIALYRGEWAGYAKVCRSQPPECVTADPAMELCRLYCLQQYIGCGIGQALINECSTHARSLGYHALWLGSWEKNLRGNAFYHKMQFQIAGTTTFTLGSDVQQDHVFVKSLN